MATIEKSGKTVDEAVNDAVKALGVTKDEVNVTVLEQGTKGIFGIGAKLARVSVALKFNPEKASKEFLREVAASMNVIVEIKTELVDRNLNIEIIGDNVSVFIGKHGQTLDALQYLVNLVVNKGEAPYVNVNLDTANYRKKRKETLENLAISLAKKVKQTKRKIVLEPMSSYERRIIHSALQNDRYVETYSEGEEPYRNVVVSLKNSR